MVANLLGDVLAKNSIAACNVEPKFVEQLDSPEHVFYIWVPLTFQFNGFQFSTCLTDISTYRNNGNTNILEMSAVVI